MADYFTQFSCTLDVGTTENAHRAVELFQSYGDRLEHEGSTLPGFGLSISGDTALWIHDDGCGDIGQVTEFVIECARTLGLKGRWGFEWGHTCSKPRVDGFGGGAQIIDLETGDYDLWIGTSDWLRRHLSDGQE